MDPQQRREFLKRSTTALVGVSLANSSRLFSGEAKDIKVGVITEPTGTHMSAYFKSLGVCSGIQQVALAGTSGQNFEKAQELLGARGRDARTFSDYREMLKSIRPEMVLVSVETHHAPERIQAALEAGCHVLTEKPPCTRIEDFERLCQMATSRQLHLMVALATRLNPLAVKARELVQAGTIGKLYGTTMTWIADQTRLKNPAYHQSWLASKEKAGGGKLIFHGIHYLDLIEHITEDRIQEVCGFVRNVGGQPIAVEDAAVVALQFKGGMVGTLNTGYYLDKGYSNLISIWGSQGWLRFDLPAKTPLTWYSTLPGASKEIQSHSIGSESDDYGLMMQNAVNASRGMERPFMTPAESLQVMKVIFSAYRSAETGITQRV
jgi:UDP-N-acetyl-2-amino-2-deoxyglucuronate dehydrogenase